jgi:hypothetical protein
MRCGIFIHYYGVFGGLLRVGTDRCPLYLTAPTSTPIVPCYGSTRFASLAIPPRFVIYGKKNKWSEINLRCDIADFFIVNDIIKKRYMV